MKFCTRTVSKKPSCKIVRIFINLNYIYLGMSTKRLTLSAFFMALVIILSSSLLSIPVPGGHFYFNGIVIFLVGLIFPPTEAVIIAGVGSFIGDFLFYPLPMWVTLVTHSLQVLAIALIVGRRLGKLSKSRAILGLLLGALIDLVGYGLGRAFVYGTPAVAIMKLPFDIVAAIIGLGLAYYIYFHTGFVKQFKKAWERN